jgi:hypothetical protein
MKIDFIQYFDKFDREDIKKAIVVHLTKNPTDNLEHCKEPNKKDIKRFYGNEILDFYAVNPNNKKVSKIITKGNKTFYLKLRD